MASNAVKKEMFMRKLVLGFAALALVSGIFAQEAFTKTGEGVRVKAIAFINVSVYYIVHSMKGPLPAKNPQAIINADQDKTFWLSMMRDIDSAKIVNAIQEAYVRNGYNNAGNGQACFGVITGELKQNDTITIYYSSASKTVTCSYKGKSASVGGVDFMKATWSIWFGNIDQPALTQQLMANMP